MLMTLRQKTIDSLESESEANLIATPARANITAPATTQTAPSNSRLLASSVFMAPSPTRASRHPMTSAHGRAAMGDSLRDPGPEAHRPPAHPSHFGVRAQPLSQCG